jgi:hypothetical protein
MFATLLEIKVWRSFATAAVAAMQLVTIFGATIESTNGLRFLFLLLLLLLFAFLAYLVLGAQLLLRRLATAGILIVVFRSLRKMILNGSLSREKCSKTQTFSSYLVSELETIFTSSLESIHQMFIFHVTSTWQFDLGFRLPILVAIQANARVS